MNLSHLNMWGVSNIFYQILELPVTRPDQCNLSLEVVGREEIEQSKLMKHKVIAESLESLVNMGNVCSSNNNNKVCRTGDTMEHCNNLI